MSIVITVLVAVLIFFLIIIIHEFGHYSAARLFKMRVYEFSLGMGPALIKRRGKNGTVYSLKVFPIGGSVQLGEDYDEEIDNDPNSFRNKPVWQRMIVILAGAFFNLILGLMVCIILVGTDDAIPTKKIDAFADLAISNSQLKDGDEILAINNMTIWTLSDISYQLFNTSSKIKDENFASFDFLVKRNNEKLLLRDVKFYAFPNENGGKQIAIDFNLKFEDKNIINVIGESVNRIFSLSRIVVLSLNDLVRGTYGLNDLSGPIGVADEIEKNVTEVIEREQSFVESLKIGTGMALSMLALITINVGIFNLLPIPALDGARFLFFIIEAIRRKPIKARVESMIHFAGFAFLMLLVLFVTFNDVRKVIFF